MENKSTMDFELTCKLLGVTIISFLVAFTIVIGFLLNMHINYVKLENKSKNITKENTELTTSYNKLEDNYNDTVSRNHQLIQQVQALEAENTELKK